MRNIKEEQNLQLKKVLLRLDLNVPLEDGKITDPVKGATLIGSGFDVLKKVSMIGDDMELDPGIGTCGKNGQGVPVGVGQPTLKIDGLTVGGTETS